MSGFWQATMDLITSYGSLISLAGLAIFGVMAVNALVAVYFERKVSAFMQDRLGPMEVGIFGFKGGRKFWGGIGQTLADALKLLTKEDVLPDKSDKALMILSPFIIFVGAFVTFVGVPFSSYLLISRFDIGIFFILAMSSVGVVGIILAGWGSNNKWSLYGSLRSAAQIISYEIPAGLSILLVVITAGTLSIHGIVEWQAEHRWFIFHSPFAFIAFFIYFISGVAETNRTPFDIPEAESELVAGWMTEFSGFRWALFFLSEYANMLIISLLASVVFLGGWLSPMAMFDIFPESWMIMDGALWGMFWLLLKAIILIFVMMWFRWTFPRLRVDQLMYLCWKVLLPFSLVNLVAVSIWELLF
ncbi:MAG: NADH-quinone oxidoreductase subunit NuoH [Candidatus Marinimicrobia bacterium]|jgi:NADH-quinone oxidoreductase subunit H|nr:NADH-quinone oxidoreductase subunit NuoH [Candidatus Neomarinimicrobiota bacterium]MBT3682659.1 NADH-quinone oxidoreductase subunit NuoH [Candidatus Neomarinimicrobiota bacterium]MBT3759686.1 NADH-quinone oxidoreductase subunit NuoH [Candidatus Neomarinimicrobiota bacterium]MBT3894443.1 NADH-quinone oxidoreductase subunit NuoH [Candidatus Neomarinimicrobiota bacterium]MBT4172485.1 NADH-quinone oxidoreductase subunit NuoH [Candidatus Neomarinimicrobiota bacterium]